MISAPCCLASWAYRSCFWIIDSLSPVQVACSSAPRTIRDIATPSFEACGPARGRDRTAFRPGPCRESRKDTPGGRRREESVAGGRPSVGERLARDRQEPPVVAAGAERELEDAMGDGVANHAVRLRRAERPERRAARPHDELADAGRARDTGRRLGSEPLVVVVVAVEDELRVRVLQ